MTLSRNYSMKNMESLQAFFNHERSVLKASENMAAAKDSAGMKNHISLGSIVTWCFTKLRALICGKTQFNENKGEGRISFKTHYGIRVEINGNANQVMRIFIQAEQDQPTLIAPPNGIHAAVVTQDGTSNTTPLSSSDLLEEAQKLRYRIFPDWQTSYLWYDPLWSGNPTDTYVVEEEEIEDKYPVLYPFFSDWVTRSEIRFDQEFGQVNHHKAATMVGRAQMVAWEINGFLMGCWLALQDNIDSVVFESTKKYEIRRGAMELEFENFLRDKEIELQLEDRKFSYLQD
jgi:hypothetical protein